MENRQDTSLLRDSLISSLSYLKDIKKSKEILNLNDEETAVQMVVSTVGSLASNLYGINSFYELFQKQQDINQRCHAVIFINLLKSQNIVCQEASSFYQSVLYDVDNLSWSYYLNLNFLCHWSEYFIECAHQLQPDVLTLILEKLLEVQCDEELKFYACHLALQAYIRKSFELGFPSNEKSITELNFAFNFYLPKSYLENAEVEKCVSKNSMSENLFDNILKHLTKESNQKADINFIKVVFHGFKSIFKLGSGVYRDEETGSCFEKLNLLTPLFVRCLTEEVMVSTLLECMRKPFYGLMDSGYQLLSWEINEVYLLFLLQNFWRDFKHRPLNKTDSELSLKSFSSFYSEFSVCMKQNDLAYKTLDKINEKYLNNCSKTRENYFLLLTVIVKHHYPYASRAAEILLSNPQLWKQYNVITLLEENTDVLDPLELHVTLSNAIIKVGSSEMHERLLNIFYKVLSQAKLEIYNLTLENILKNWGFCDSFITTNFDNRLTQLARKTMSLKEVENSLLPLFVQSPRVVLQFLIEQTMMQGIDGMDALKVLKTIPVACMHEFGKEPVAPLVEILSSYFEHSLRSNEAKHFVILLKSLMEIQVTEDIISFDLFLDKCIFPNSVTQNVDQLGFTLECLYAALDVLISNHALEISNEKYIALLKHLGSILSFCIENGLGKLKETVVDIMESLSKHKKRPQLHALFENEVKSNYNEDVVKLYVIGIFFKERKSELESGLLKWKNNVIKENFQYLWIWCCITCNNEDFVDNVRVHQLSFLNLLKCLPMILWHLTKSEWLQSAKLIIFVSYLLKLGASDYPWLLPDNDPELYGAIRCLMDCFTIMMKEKNSRDVLYCSNCLTNTIMGLVNKSTIPPSLLVNVFLDICCVSSYIDSEAFFMFSSVLMNLQKQYLSICDKANKKDYLTLMKFGLSNIQNDAVDKETLKDKFCKV